MRKSIQLLLCLFLLPWAAIAQEDCFCLKDRAENVTIDCVKVKQAVEGEQVLCYDPVERHRVPVQNTAGLREIPAGKPGCQPCLTPDGNPDDVPRGDEEKKGGAPGK